MNISPKTTDRLYLLAFFGTIAVASLAVLLFQFAWWAILGGLLAGALVLGLITRWHQRIVQKQVDQDLQSEREPT